MRKALTGTVMVGVFALVGSVSQSASCPATVTAKSAEADKKAILQVISDMQDAWNRGDFRGYMQGFKNPDVVFVSGGRFQLPSIRSTAGPAAAGEH